MEQKKMTAAQLQRRLNNAVLHIDKTKNTKSIFFIDKGMRIVVCEEEVLIQTGYHTHVFMKLTSSGYSRPAMYAERFLDLALENDCMTYDSKGNKQGYSYGKLMQTLKAKEDKTEYNIAQYVDWYFFDIFAPLYSIDENAAGQFNVYFKYLSNIATQHIFLSEHKDGMTNKQFVEEHNKLMGEFLKNLTEALIFEPMSDEERMKQEMEALQEQDVEQQNENQNGGN